MAKSVEIFVMGLMVYFVGMAPRWEWTFLQEGLSIYCRCSVKSLPWVPGRKSNLGLLTSKLRHAFLVITILKILFASCHWISLCFKNHSSLVHQRSFLCNDGWYGFYSSTPALSSGDIFFLICLQIAGRAKRGYLRGVLCIICIITIYYGLEGCSFKEGSVAHQGVA